MPCLAAAAPPVHWRDSRSALAASSWRSSTVRTAEIASREASAGAHGTRRHHRHRSRHPERHRHGRDLASVLAGESGIAPITLFDATRLPTRNSPARSRTSSPTQFIEKKKLKEMDRFTQLSMAASKLGHRRTAQLELTDEERERAGCFIGVGLGGLEGLETTRQTLAAKGPSKISPYFIPSVIANLAAGQVSMAYGLRGPSYCNTSACSSSGARHRRGVRVDPPRRTDVMVAGGAEATITGLGIGGFGAMFALSRRNDDPARASRPFDKGRDGFVMRRRARARLVLESLTRAKKRGAKIYAEVTGYGASSDAYHLTQPAPDGEGAQRAMRMALEDAKLDPPSDRLHQRARHLDAAGRHRGVRARSRRCSATHAHLEEALGVSSTKSMMGHLLGGAGAVEAALCALAIARRARPADHQPRGPGSRSARSTTCPTRRASGASSTR